MLRFFFKMNFPQLLRKYCCHSQLRFPLVSAADLSWLTVVQLHSTYVRILNGSCFVEWTLCRRFRLRTDWDEAVVALYDSVCRPHIDCIAKKVVNDKLILLQDIEAYRIKSFPLTSFRETATAVVVTCAIGSVFTFIFY